MADVFKGRGIQYTPLVLDSKQELGEAFRGGRCQALTAERTVLAALRAAVPNGVERYTILPGAISKEPLAPAVRRGDDEWTKLIRWVLFALIEAEERGSRNRMCVHCRKKALTRRCNGFSTHAAAREIPLD